jgi:hypothetical protein
MVTKKGSVLLDPGSKMDKIRTRNKHARTAILVKTDSDLALDQDPVLDLTLT